MSENRPDELNSCLEAMAEKNDALVIGALEKLEDPERRGRFKITVASICQITGLARNTVRNRKWALDRLKALKLKLKSVPPEASSDGKGVLDDGAILDKLRKRVKDLLQQNALLYEEILSLHLVVEKKDKVIEALKARKLASVTSLPRPIEYPNRT